MVGITWDLDPVAMGLEEVEEEDLEVEVEWLEVFGMGFRKTEGEDGVFFGILWLFPMAAKIGPRAATKIGSRAAAKIGPLAAAKIGPFGCENRTFRPRKSDLSAAKIRPLGRENRTLGGRENRTSGGRENRTSGGRRNRRYSRKIGDLPPENGNFGHAIEWRKDGWMD